MHWNSQETSVHEKKVRITEYLNRFLATAEEDADLSKCDMSYSIVERYLLLIDWLQNAPAVVQAIKADYEPLVNSVPSV